MGRPDTCLLPGTLHLLILKTVALQPMHGLGIVRRIEQITGGAFQVSLGALFPALHRAEQEGWIAAAWGRSENNRKAKFYRLTAAGRRALDNETRNWQRVTDAMARVLEAT